MNRITLYVILISTLSFSCNRKDTKDLNVERQEFMSRDSAAGQLLGRAPLYRANVPLKWVKKDFPAYISNHETTKPLVEFFVDDIHITVHNFPRKSMNDGIPPEAQIVRWKNQYDELREPNIHITPCAQGGFVGYRFMAEGIIGKKPVTTIAWAMHLDTEHDERLQFIPHSDHPYIEQMRADWTIKAVGSPERMKDHYFELIAFARSFELIQEIP